MSDPAELERLRALRLDDATGARQRLLVRSMIAVSVALVIVGQIVAWWKGEPLEETHDPVALLRALPSGHSLMLLGLIVGIASPLARAALLARWFARRGERAMVWISLALLAITLSGLLVRH